MNKNIVFTCEKHIIPYLPINYEWNLETIVGQSNQPWNNSSSNHQHL